MRSRQQSSQIESSDPGEEEDKGGGRGGRWGMRERKRHWEREGMM